VKLATYITSVLDPVLLPPTSYNKAIANDCWGYPICGLVLINALLLCGLVDLGDAVADELSLPFDRISLDDLSRFVPF